MHTNSPNLSNIDINLLRIFRTVVECNGLSAAETDLNLGRSTISKRLSDLEHRLGMTLCHRGPAGFSISAEGAKVLIAADELLHSISSFQNEIHGIKGQMRGILHLAMFDQLLSNPKARIAEAISHFKAEAPAVDLELNLLPPIEIEKRLLSGTLHIGILSPFELSGDLRSIPAHDEDMYLYCSAKHPLFHATQITVADILACDVVGLGLKSPNQSISREFGLKVSAKVQSEQMLALLITSGIYIGFLPKHMEENLHQNTPIRQLIPQKYHYKTDFVAAFRATPKPTRMVQTFLNHLSQLYSASK